MQITPHPAAAPSTPRRLAREAYDQALNGFEQVGAPHLDKVETLERWKDRASLAAGVVGFAGAITLLIANGVADQGLYAAGPVALGIGFAVRFAIDKIGSAYLARTTMPAFQQARQELIDRREAYREALLTELGDDGVRQATTATWNELKEWERSDASLRRPSEELAGQLHDLESLADRRLETGWESRIAHLTDDPAELARDVDLVERSPAIKQTLEAYEDASRDQAA